MKSKLVYTSFSFLVLSAIFLLYLKFFVPTGKDGILLRLKLAVFNENNVEVTISDELIDPKAIYITWSGEFVRERIIWSNGSVAENIPYEYGPQRFKVFYEDQLIGKSSQFKTNNWRSHNYYFHIHRIKNTSKMAFDFFADGPNNCKLENIYFD